MVSRSFGFVCLVFCLCACGDDDAPATEPDASEDGGLPEEDGGLPEEDGSMPSEDGDVPKDGAPDATLPGDAQVDAAPVCVPTTSSCNGADNDCNGVIDDAEPPCSPCTERRLTKNDGNTLRPAIAWNGTELGVAFNDNRAGEQLWFMRVSSDGSPLATEIPIASMSHDYTPSIVWAGTRWGIVYTDASDGNEEIYYARVSAAGVVETTPVRLTTTAAASVSPRAVWDGAGIGVVYQEGTEVSYLRIDPMGGSLTAPSQISAASDSSRDPAVVWDGTSNVVVWSDDRHGDSEVYFARVTTAGALESGEVRVTNAGGFSTTVAIASSGTNFGLVWIDARNASAGEVFFARVTSAGALIGEEARITMSGEEVYLPAITFGSGVYTFSWNDLRGDSDDVRFGVRDATSGASVADETPFTTDSIATGYEAAAFDGEDAIVVFYDARDGNNELYAGHVSVDGECL